MERAALERDVIYSNLALHAVLVQSKLKAPRRISSWLRPSRRGSRLIRSRHPPKHMPKLTKSDQKVVQIESQRGSRTSFGGQKPKMDARRAKRPILVAKSVPQGCQNGSQMGLKIL